ncbi:MAG: hypothetical protein M1130_06075, partial [Actinobacteria bacterium]|nr:hypothetical protein [Actinomycetota bacterium]
MILRERKAVDIVPDPISKKYYLDLPAPGLSDNRADVDRVRQELARTIGPVAIAPEIMNSISRVLRES